MTWQESAACKGKEEIFDGKETRGNASSVYPNLKEARVICESCPVKTECLSHALDNYEYGIWGGTTEHERERMRRKGAAA